MISKKALFYGITCLATLGSLYAVLSMLTQAMLSGTSQEAVWWSRVYVWWVDFLAAGLLMMLAIYLWRKARRLDALITAGSSRGDAWRVVLFPVGFLLLTGCLYFADIASYLKGKDGVGKHTAIAVVLFLAMIAVFWQARKLRTKS